MLISDNQTAAAAGDQIQVQDVILAIPKGRFQSIMTFLYITLFLSTSTLAYNFAFFLLPQTYQCPVNIMPTT